MNATTFGKSRRQTIPRVLSKVQGNVEDIEAAMERMDYSNPDSGINCTFFDYTYHTQHEDIVVKFNHN